MVVTRSKSRQVGSAGMKFSNPNIRKGHGKISLPEPATVPQVGVMMILHVCRKIMLFESHLKVCIYLGALFIGGLVGDFFPIPKTYLARKDNIFNVYFVKWGWAWTLLIVGSFIYFTSFVYCCGCKRRIAKHMCRLLVGTAFWYLWTTLFVHIEQMTGVCSGGEYKNKSICVKNNFKWFGFDISGHSFLLIYSSLIMMEEAKAFRGWERIAEILRFDKFDEDTPLRSLKDEELQTLRLYHEKYIPHVRGAFVAMTNLLLLWDVMLIGTTLYHHNMVQKIAGGIIATFTWFFTYRFWFQNDKFPSPGRPGLGQFVYNVERPCFKGRKSSVVGLKKNYES